MAIRWRRKRAAGKPGPAPRAGSTAPDAQVTYEGIVRTGFVPTARIGEFEAALGRVRRPKDIALWIGSAAIGGTLPAISATPHAHWLPWLFVGEVSASALAGVVWLWRRPGERRVRDALYADEVFRVTDFAITLAGDTPKVTSDPPPSTLAQVKPQPEFRPQPDPPPKKQAEAAPPDVSESE